ncbi:HAD domain-containing protein [Paraburkholderia caffeinilytica]|uniref:HAD domain-containing protein n=1 Tax=Paraburkholderia caffeinilytica TaxID=1761016 RepID=UPI0038BB8DC5
MTLYLNFDGVLHPDQVVYREGLTPSLVATGHSAFEHAGLLSEILEQHDEVELVLNTWWTFFVCIDSVLELLPTALASRVVDTTLECSSRYDSLPSRSKEAERHIASKNKRQVLVLDNSNSRYSRDLIPHMLLVDPTVGLASIAARRALARRISLTPLLPN